MNLLAGHEHGPGQPLVITFIGAPGGGTSTLTAQLGRFLTRKGKRVLLVDADIVQPRLHHLLGYDVSALSATAAPVDERPLRDLIVHSAGSDRMPLLALGLALQAPFRGSSYRGASLVARLRGLPYDVILVDAPGTPGPAASSVFALSDVPILVTTVETAALRATTSHLRWALIYGMLNHPDARRMGPQLIDRVERLGVEDDIVRILEVFDGSPAAAILDSVLQRLGTYLVVNKTRESSDRDLGQVIALAWYRALGLRPRVLGAVDFDDRRWFHERQDAFLSPLDSSEGTGAHIEELGKRVLALGSLDLEQPRVPYGAPMDATELLGVSKRATPLEVRLAYRRLWEGLRRDSCVTRQLMSREARTAELEGLEEANRALQTWLAERTDPVEAPPPRPVGGSPGRVLREARQRLELSLRELSLRTRIGLRYIEAIEAFEVEQLPRPAYLRGYLREIARVLQLDAEPVLDAYLSALAEVRSKRLLKH